MPTDNESLDVSSTFDLVHFVIGPSFVPGDV